MLTLFSFILVFGLLVFFHEFGHFIFAKLNDIKVHEFALGMGPKLLSYKGKETEYSIRILPIGGYVKMEGEDGASEDIRSFSKKSPLQRISVIAAGPIMNIILAILLFMIIGFSIGVPINVINEVTENYPAYKAGIQPGDKIIKINDNKINSWDDIVKNVSQSSTDVLKITLIRDGKKMSLDVKPIFDKKTNKKLIGISPVFSKSIFASFKFSVERVVLITKGIGNFLLNLVKGKASSKEIVGPIGMVHFVGEAARISIFSLMSLAALISINLAILNLLPFPALDGGRLVFIIIELILGKPIDPEKEGFVHFIGFIILLGLMVFVIYKDITRFNLF
ncbi:regulator of sigma E protease [Caminicella sporogenes DSM 14501]|uniref:Zinc metalloprotease n=1 Tax=Caminicella sporogenes DSM 14501 TaxID=1121266 RepID=A0A1M6L8W6_9FIRM|nr:RIP metalloprotease RseP [Caminicella sporogenes]RKD27748.1 RIP metalloprotease RseP [Caminicella sporogenes]SHJ67651.1 regulator of sigma E protease [Caminicella sporogenes DSM 14501]